MHAGLERAQLFELLAQFQRGRLQADESRQCRACKRVDADVVEKRSSPAGARARVK
jgi:hypothetical protein